MHEDPPLVPGSHLKSEVRFKKFDFGCPPWPLKVREICQKRFPSEKENGSNFMISDKTQFKGRSHVYYVEINIFIGL